MTRALLRSRPRLSSTAADGSPGAASTNAFTRESLAASVARGEKLILIGDRVYDVASLFSPGAHPGGAEVLDAVIGGDSTDQFFNSHPAWVAARLPPLCVGRMTGWTPSASTLAYRALRDELTAEGAFTSSYLYYLVSFGRAAVLFVTALGVICLSRSSWAHVLVAAPALGLFWQQLAFVGHDLGHSSVSHSRARDGLVGLVIGPALTGLSFSWWKATHHAHHISTNSATHDCDVQHTPLLAVSPVFFKSLWSAFHNKRMGFGSCARSSVAAQHLFFFPLMFWARWNLYFQGVCALVLGPRTWHAAAGGAALGFFAAYMTLIVLAVGRAQPTLVLALAVRVVFLCLSNGVAGILHVQIVLSHFAQPVLTGRATDEGVTFLEAQLRGTTNIALDKYADWTFGGLQWQVEHHLFPRLPAEKLRALAPRVVALCKAHGLPYNSASFYKANLNLFNKLRETAALADGLDPLVLDALLLRG